MPMKGMRTLLFTLKSKQPLWPSSPSGDASSSTAYSLASTPGRNTQSMIDRSIAMADLMVTKWNPDTSGYAQVTSLFYENRKEAMEFIKCVFNLQKSMHLISHDDPNNNLVRAHNLMQIAMKRLQKEFYQTLSTNRAHLDPESVSTRSSQTSSTASISDFEDKSLSAETSMSETEQVSLLAMEDLRCIAECMTASGYAKECYKIYTIIRKSVVDETLYKLGIQKITQNQFNKLNSQSQDLKIQEWKHATKIALQTLFPGERILCDHIFEASDTLRETCFIETTKEAANLLFTFPHLISNSKSNISADKILHLLDIYTTLIDYLNHIDAVFSSDSSSAIRAQVTNSLPKLANAIRSMFYEFESTIRKDTLKAISATAGGGIDPLIIYTMNTLSTLSNHARLFNDNLSTHPVKSTEKIFAGDGSSPPYTAAITLHVTNLINVVISKIDHRSKLYKDMSTSFLFIANNLNYVVDKINRSNLKFIIGDRLIRNQEVRIKNSIIDYVAAAWGGVIGALPELTAAISTAEVKERFKRFNVRFSEAYRKQSACVVEDQKLRNEIRVCVEEILVAKYREFFGQNGGRVGRGEREGSLNLVVRYTPEDVVNYLSDLYFDEGGGEVDEGGDSMSFASPSLSVMSAENQFKIY